MTTINLLTQQFVIHIKGFDQFFTVQLLLLVHHNDDKTLYTQWHKSTKSLLVSLYYFVSFGRTETGFAG